MNFRFDYLILIFNVKKIVKIIRKIIKINIK